MSFATMAQRETQLPAAQAQRARTATSQHTSLPAVKMAQLPFALRALKMHPRMASRTADSSPRKAVVGVLLCADDERQAPGAQSG